MYLYSKLESFKKEIHIAFIGCGKFVTMFLAQLNNLKYKSKYHSRFRYIKSKRQLFKEWT